MFSESCLVQSIFPPADAWDVLFVDKPATSRILNREMLLLVLLGLTAIGVFVFTRSMAAKEQQMESRVASVWYEQGERELRSGDIEKAIESFRRATASSRENRTYALALAHALAAGNHTAEAQQALLRLREADPEDAEINLQLARLLARRGEIADAVRSYQNAVYGRWTGSQVDERRRQLRIELIQLLLEHHEQNGALSELLILETDLPQTPQYHIETAKLFLQADDALDALQNYKNALRLDSRNIEALIGAGQASFQIGNYTLAEHYLKAASALTPQSLQAQQLLSAAEMVLSSDPLTFHIGKEERQRRLLIGLQQAIERAEVCSSHSSDQKTNSELQELKSKAVAMGSDLQSGSQLPDTEFASSGVDLIYEIEKAASTNCGTPTGFDQALLLIGMKHGGA
jgi:tetratricopeptide (TPR) repeat protein